MDDTEQQRGPGRPRKQAVPLGSTGAEPPANFQGAQPERKAVEEPAGHVVGRNGRRRRAKMGMAGLKLAAPSRPGYHRRWFNDDGNRLAEAYELGYDPVTEQGIETSDPGSPISRIVGTDANGKPLRAFLYETPDELYAEGLREKEAHNRRVDEAITAGRDSTGQLVNETYGQGTIERDR